MSRKIFLIGLPGSGKTTMGLELGLHLTLPFIDLDQEIEKETKQSVGSIFEEKGEAHFRQLEKWHLQKSVDSVPSFVMATGGGTPCFFDNLELMKAAGETVYINTGVETIKERLEMDSTRPLMNNNSLEDLLTRREHFYTDAKYQVTTLSDLIQLF
ncbi:MAG: shikimate kinase [Ekhidna sp.]